MTICPRSEKACIHCHRVKPLDDFYRHSGMADGRLNVCKPCKRRYQKAYAINNPDKVRASDRRKRDKRRAHYSQLSAEWARKNRRRRRESLAAWEARNPEKKRANTAVNNAIRDGRLRRLPCEICGGEPTHGHHGDYSKPLDVRWLCRNCHGAVHRQLNDSKRSNLKAVPR